MAAVIQFQVFIIMVGTFIAGAVFWSAPRTFYEKPVGGFAGTYRCLDSTQLSGMENHEVRINEDLKMSMIGSGVELPIGSLVPVPGNPKLATLQLSEGMRRPGSEFNPLLVHEVEGHGRYIYLRGVQNGQEQYSISCTN